MFQTWYDSVIGRKIDMDNDSSVDCVDVPKSWLEFLHPDVSWVYLTGWGNAKDLFNNSNPTYVKKINYSAGLVPVQGDIVVWDATATNRYGHIAVTVSATATSLTVIEENSYTQAAAYLATRSYNNVIGFLRPIGVIMSSPSADEVKSAFATYKVPGPTADQVTYYAARDWSTLLDDLLHYVFNELKALQAQAAVTKTSVLAYVQNHLS